MRALDFALNNILPESLRKPTHDVSKNGVATLMAAIARDYPDSYREVSKKIGDLGRQSAYLQGYTVGPNDTAPVIDTQTYYDRMDGELAALRKQGLEEGAFNAARTAILLRYSEDIEKDTMDAATKSGNAFARAVASGARGNAAHVKAILSTPGVYQDAQGRVIPLFVRNSFAGGVRPAETLAGTYGARAAVVSTKTCLLETTLVRMADGSEKQIKDVAVGDMVVGADKAGTTFPTRVSRIYDQGLQDVWRWKLRGSNSRLPGVELYATDTHRALMTDPATYKRKKARYARGTGDAPLASDAYTTATLPLSMLGVGRRKLVLVCSPFIPGAKRDRLAGYELKQQNPNATLSLASRVLVGQMPCRDIEVEHEDHLFLLANGVVVSNSTAKGGDVAKLLNQSTSHYNVTEKDCGARNGLDFDPGDKSLRGRVLARDIGEFKAGDVIDKHVAGKLAKQDKLVIARSALTCSSRNGICARCAGVEPDGNFPRVGSSIGITAAQSMCLDADTLVRMADGSARRIEDLVPGDMVMGSDVRGVLAPTKVLDLYDKGVQDCYRYTFTQGRRNGGDEVVLVCTPNHKMLGVTKGRKSNAAVTPDDFHVTTAGELDSSKRSYAVFPQWFDDTGCLHVPEARMIGVLLGDGCITGGVAAGGLGLSCYDPAMVLDLAADLTAMGMHLQATTDGEYRVSMTAGPCAPYQITKNGDQVRNAMKRILINHDLWGKSAAQKTLPASVHLWDNESVANLLAGLIATDGFVGKKQRGVGFTGNSKALLDGVAHLLKIRFGVKATAVTGSKKKKPTGDFYATTYTTVVSATKSLRLLAEHIAEYIPGRKRKLLTSYLQRFDVEKLSTKEVTQNQTFVSSSPVGSRRTFDIHVDNKDHLFLLDNYLIVSNSEPIVQGALNCLAEGTMVRMADYTTRPIETIRKGEWVVGADKLGNTFPVRVGAVWDQGLQPVQRFTYGMAPTRQTLEVVCTPIHEILTTTSYSGAKEEAYNYTPRKLPAGRVPGKPSAVLPVSHLTASVESEPLAGLLGFWMGDGIRWDAKKTLKLSCAAADVARDLVAEAQAIGISIRKLAASHDWVICDEDEGGKRTQHRLKAAVDRLGWTGDYYHQKQIPHELWNWDDASLKRFVAGYWSADGSTYRNKRRAPGVALGSTSRQLLERLKELLAVRFGIYTSSITCTGKVDTWNRKNAMWQFTVNRRDQVARFADAFAEYAYGGKGQLLRTYLLEAPRSHFQNQPFFKAPRRQVEVVGNLHCYDITVEHPDELFVLANSLIVSNTKHNGGAAKGKRSFSGFGVISQFMQAPSEFKDRATVAEQDGTVTAVRDAPQGGRIITVDNVDHFVLPGFDLTVKPGDMVEAGDQLSDGLVNPADVVRLRGLGEGRRYYADRLEQILNDSGQPPDRRNVELVARATIDHLRMDDPDEDSDFLPDDLVREADFMASYKSPTDTEDTVIHKLPGRYLEQPVLHYTVGTRVTPKMRDHMSKAGVTSALTSTTAPSFSADMQRLRTATHSDRDWLSSLSTSYLGKQTTQAAERGDETNIESNHHFAPRLAAGAGFGDKIETTGKF